MHCHFAWYTSEGFAFRIVEREAEIGYDSDALNSTCAESNLYVASEGLVQYDFGI